MSVGECDAKHGRANQPGLMHQQVRDDVGDEGERKQHWRLERFGNEIAPERPGH